MVVFEVGTLLQTQEGGLKKGPDLNHHLPDPLSTPTFYKLIYFFEHYISVKRPNANNMDAEALEEVNHLYKGYIDDMIVFSLSLHGSFG